MKKLIAISALCLVTINSYAWGDREQGLLTGAAGVLLLQNITRPNQEHHHHNHQPMYQQPRTTYETNIYYPRQPVKSCVMYPVYDQYGVVIGQQNVCDYR